MSRTRLSDWSADDLERAAKYLKELDRSPNAKAAIELAKREQDVAIAGEHARAKEAEAQRAAAQGEVEQLRWAEQRKTIEHRAAHERNTVDYKAQKQRALLSEEDELRRRRDEDIRRKGLEDERTKAKIRAAAELEIQQARQKADEFRAKLERESLTAKALAEAEGRIKEQRQNEDVIARQNERLAALSRQTRLQEVGLVLDRLGAGLTTFLSSPPQMLAAAGALTAVAGGVYGVREVARVGGRYVESRMGRPSLIRETSRLSLLPGSHRTSGAAAAQGNKEKGMPGRLFSSAPDVSSSLSDVILPAELSIRLQRTASAVASSRVHGAHLRNLLLHGPPGTGKTMAAKRLARSCGMDYAVLTGGDVSPLGRDAVTELHKLFDWAERSRKGLLLFIDEAEAFLGSRARGGLTEDSRNALNAFLYRTGEASSRLMVVVSTNRPQDLDPAVTDRMDEALHFTLPDLPSRQAMVKQYFNAYVRQAGEGRSGLMSSLLGHQPPGHISISPDVSDGYLDTIADRLDGFSGREISKLMLSVQADAYGRTPAGRQPTVSAADVDAVVRWKLQEHRFKQLLLQAGNNSGGSEAASSSSISPAETGSFSRPSEPAAVELR